jgi:hypothetical protein
VIGFAFDAFCLFMRRKCVVSAALFYSILQLLWAAVSNCCDGIELLMECGCDAVAALAWLKSFDLDLEQAVMPKSHDSRTQSSVSSSGRNSPNTRRSVLVHSYSVASLMQGLRLLTRCLQEKGNYVEVPAIAQLHASEVFATPRVSDIKWTSRVRGVCMQANQPCQLYPIANNSLLFCSSDGLTGV